MWAVARVSAESSVACSLTTGNEQSKLSETLHHWRHESWSSIRQSCGCQFQCKLACQPGFCSMDYSGAQKYKESKLREVFTGRCLRTIKISVFDIYQPGPRARRILSVAEQIPQRKAEYTEPKTANEIKILSLTDDHSQFSDEDIQTSKANFSWAQQLADNAEPGISLFGPSKHVTGDYFDYFMQLFIQKTDCEIDYMQPTAINFDHILYTAGCLCLRELFWSASIVCPSNVILLTLHWLGPWKWFQS